MTDYTQYPAHILPYPQLAGYRIERPSGVVRVAMASGRTRNRRTWFNQPGKLPALKFKFTSTELETFESWVHYALDGGAAQFTFPVKTPSGIIDHVCKFTSDYQQQALSPQLWEVTVDVEVEALAMIDVGELVSRVDGVNDAVTLLEDGLAAAVTDYVTPESN